MFGPGLCLRPRGELCPGPLGRTKTRQLRRDRRISNTLIMQSAATTPLALRWEQHRCLLERILNVNSLCAFALSCFAMLSNKQAGLTLRVRCWLSQKGLRCSSAEELKNVSEACVLADLAAAGDWDGLEVEDAPLLRSFRNAITEQLRRIALDETAVGDARREASRLAKRGKPDHETKRHDAACLSALGTCSGPLSQPHSNSALLAIAKLKAASKTCNQPSAVARGAKQGFEMLQGALSLGLDAGTWTEHAVRDAVACSAPGSVRSACSALRWWAAFADEVLGRNGHHLPPTDHDLAAWSRLFRSGATFSNYVGYLRLGCHVLGIDSSPSCGPLARRAKMSLQKHQAPPREKLFLDETLTVRLAGLAVAQGDEAESMLYTAAYCMMLRVPSELLPVVMGQEGDAERPLAEGAHSCMSLCGDELVLRLASRKNKPHGSVLRRGCWCTTRCAELCPVHALGAWVSSLPRAWTPFAGTSAGAARTTLKAILLQLRTPKAAQYWLHDFRRGHAQDLACHGGRLSEILAAGEWASPAFAKYLDLEQLETRCVVEAHLDESEVEDEK
jgi:hypothetical protein